MSSYDPPEESEDGSNFDPGVKEKEITEQREFSDLLGNFERQDYILFGLVLGIPAGILTGVLLGIMFPEYQRTAGEVVRWIGERIADIFLTQFTIFDAGELFLVG
ncbi:MULTISPECIES: hypothetical protein [Haloarcula]|uniref:Uncharacterized protein n=3 Tax=Haloarcula TaxID=2237 RepID=A0ACC6VNQ3_9EURY|nr:MULTISPECIES: hypothetical protein [Haloarcula]EMA31523.1 hypothetical protein C444_08010 [Haloarcula japonica DSM 6131]GGK85381.1 hypothetical protein GCM10009067_41870 [Haloarcula sebkhae]